MQQAIVQDTQVSKGEVKPTVVDICCLPSVLLLLATMSLIFFREPPFFDFESKLFGWVDPTTALFQEWIWDPGLAYQSIPSPPPHKNDDWFSNVSRQSSNTESRSLYWKYQERDLSHGVTGHL